MFYKPRFFKQKWFFIAVIKGTNDYLVLIKHYRYIDNCIYIRICIHALPNGRPYPFNKACLFDVENCIYASNQLLDTKLNSIEHMHHLKFVCFPKRFVSSTIVIGIQEQQKQGSLNSTHNNFIHKYSILKFTCYLAKMLRFFTHALGMLSVKSSIKDV